MSDVKNVIIIGSGPAGYTAAIYAARANLQPVMFSGLQPGGQLTITTEVENYPGFPKGVMGPEMMEMFKEQAARFGTEIVMDEVTKVDFSQRPFSVWQRDKEWKAHAVIISTGASAKLLDLPSEKALMGHGVSACATCDGFFFKNQEVVVVGGGDTAMEEANFLTKFASKVTVIHRRDSLRASKIMQERALRNPKIEFVWNSAIDEVLGEPKKGVHAVRVKNLVSGETHDLATQGVFIAIGHQPNTQLFAALAKDGNGYLLVNNGTRTSVEGVFACGDVADAVYRQAITAAGTGCMAAIDAERYLATVGIH
jgi:thioredoxin reductase (NADPH)